VPRVEADRLLDRCRCLAMAVGRGPAPFGAAFVRSATEKALYRADPDGSEELFRGSYGLPDLNHLASNRVLSRP
jgi:hypothetical protein